MLLSCSLEQFLILHANQRVGAACIFGQGKHHCLQHQSPAVPKVLARLQGARMRPLQAPEMQ